MNHPYAHVVAAGLVGECKTPRKIIVDRVDTVPGRKAYANVVYRHMGGGYADQWENVPIRGLTAMRVHAILVDEGWHRGSGPASNVVSYYPPTIQIVEE